MTTNNYALQNRSKIEMIINNKKGKVHLQIALPSQTSY